MNGGGPSGLWRFWTVVYRAEVVLALLFAEPFRALTRGRWYLEMLRQRVGFQTGAASRNALWIHAPTVGELQVASALAKALPPDLPLLITVFHEHGWSLKLAREMFGDRATVTYPPFMLASANRRFLRRFSPRAFLQIESQPWTLAGIRLVDARLPSAIINANVALRTRPILTHRLVSPLLPGLERVCVRTEEDARAYSDLGVPPERVVVTGTLKFDLPDLDPRTELKRWIRELAGGRPILVAGSVHSVEEARQVVTAFETLGSGGRALLVLAPRLIPTIERIAGMLKERRIVALRRSALPAGGAHADVLLLDSLGELPSLYEIADAVFIGGTLGAHGGHNPVEAARFAVPVAAGPNMEQFLSIAEMFDQAGAWRRVGSAGELAAVWDGWLRDSSAAREQGRRGQDLVERSRGAWNRTLEALAPFLAEVRRGA